MTGASSAGPAAEKKEEAGSKAPATAAAPESGKAATGTTSPGPAAGSSLGARQVAAKSAVGGTEDTAEKDADAAADTVMRMPETPAGSAAPASAGAGPGPAGGGKRREEAAPGSSLPVRRQAAPAAPAEAKQGDVPTPAGAAPPAPAAGAASVAKAPEAGGVPEAAEEPPAPEGEQPARGTPEVSDKVQAYLDASRGQGAPLPEKARRYFETRFRCDLSHVRIHDDAAADEAAKSIQALAFTKGSDIYFRAGAYDPEGEAGRKLLAHELAHVVQQRPGINRRGTSGDVIRRGTKPPVGSAKDDKKGGGTATTFEIPTDVTDKAKAAKAPAGKIDVPNTTISFTELHIPEFKLPYHTGALEWVRKEHSGKHADAWAKWAQPLLKGSVDKKPKDQSSPTAPYFLQFGKGSKALPFFGTAEDVASAITSLPWDRDKNPHKFDIDHQKELQLGGADDDHNNLWLLDRGINRSSGPTIRESVRQDIDDLLALARPKLANPPSDAKEVLASKYTVRFAKAKGGPRPGRSSKSKAFSPGPVTADKWAREDLSSETIVEALEPMTTELREKVKGTKETLSLFTKRGGGKVSTLPYKGKGEIDVSKLFTPGYKVVSGTYVEGNPPRTGKVGQLNVSFFEGEKGKKVLSPISHPFDLVAMPGVDYGGMVDQKSIVELRKKISTKVASPIEFPDIDFDLALGLVGRGSVPKPSIKLLENVEIAIVVEGADIGLEATISGGDLKLPGPFKVTGGAMTLSATTGGLGVDGRIDFEIEKLAKGFIGASAGLKSGGPSFSLEGELEFDTKMFTEAKLGLSYKEGKWGVKGKLAVGEGKIKGIKSASAEVAVEDETVSALGTFESSIKGIDKGKVTFKYDPKTGMEIAGEIELGKGIPGVKTGKLSATIKESPAGDYSLSGGIVIQPDVPGLSGDVTGKYEDGAFLVEANLGYEKGLAKGSVRIGVTNQAVGAEGKPAGPPTDNLLVYGGGELTLKIAPWLQGTVGVQLKPNGEIEVKGKVALPDHLDVFPEKKVEKRVFSIGIDIPIVGVAVAGQRIGIFATIKGGLDVFAGFGPGQLRNLSLEVTYNPAHEEATTVVGTGSFYVPASAGLRLSVDGGLGVGIPIVSATAGITIYGEIGVQGAAEASARVEWSPARGVILDAQGSLSVEPKFKFGIEAFVDVSADLWITTIELYHKKWNLASFEYGSNLRFGLVFPIHYEEGKPFQLSFDQVQWTYPSIEPKDLLSGLMKQIA